jgi:hypothetical protein
LIVFGFANPVSLALVLCDRFGQAKDMVHKTSEYYTLFSSTVSASAIKKWTKDMTTAESRRLKNPRAMDIIGAHKNDFHAELAGSASEPNRLTATGTEWLNLALSMEERQYVLLFSY